jgi:hypothetical protein
MSEFKWYWQCFGREGAPVLIESPEIFMATMRERGHNIQRSQLIGPITPEDTKKARLFDELQGSDRDYNRMR